MIPPKAYLSFGNSFSTSYEDCISKAIAFNKKLCDVITTSTIKHMLIVFLDANNNDHEQGRLQLEIVSVSTAVKRILQNLVGGTIKHEINVYGATRGLIAITLTGVDVNVIAYCMGIKRAMVEGYITRAEYNEFLKSNGA